MGFADEARAFLRWYAPYQLDDGRVPCAVDRHGIDHAVEHDSHGQLVWGVVEVFRLTGDRAFLRELWPHVLRAVDAIAALRAERTRDEFRGRACFGLLPESISHEGYASHPVHSYWDDFFAVRGARRCGRRGGRARRRRSEPAHRQRCATRCAAICTPPSRARSQTTGSTSCPARSSSATSIRRRPRSRSIPAPRAPRLPPAALARTFERYWEEFECRRRGETTADAYTAYEVRNAAALLMLGQKRRAVELLEWLIDDQRPVAWRQWPEVSTRDRRAPASSATCRTGGSRRASSAAVRRMLAYERADDGALVLAAGVPATWVREAPGIRVRALATHAGSLDYAMCAEGEDRVRVTLGGNLRFPSAGIVVESPLAEPLRRVAVDGREQPAADPRRVVLRSVAGDLILDYRP